MQSFKRRQGKRRRMAVLQEVLLTVATLSAMGCARLLDAQTAQQRDKVKARERSATAPLAMRKSQSRPTNPALMPELQKLPSEVNIEANDNRLYMQASNASLTEMLQRIADKTGMKIEGINGDERVFGSFGPGTPRDVISSLLNGTMYNVIMVGTLDNGAPRRLLLSTKTGSGAPVAVPAIGSMLSSDDDSADVPDDEPSSPRTMPSPTRPVGRSPLDENSPQEIPQQSAQQQKYPQ